MTNFQRKTASAIATGALLLNVFTPFAFASTTLEITGNGEKSTNSVEVKLDNKTEVVQSNNAVVQNNVSSNASSGGNKANGNTNGDVSITTGGATSKADVSTKVNKNVADVKNCNCDGDTTVKISGNGEKSENDATLGLGNTTSVFQDNNAKIDNKVDVNAKTGYNQAKSNTGGNVEITTGKATTDVTVKNSANANVAKVGGDGKNKGSLNLWITGNGEKSDNNIDVSADRSVKLIQSNYADIYNDVYADAISGNNKANGNTGGDVEITAGEASTTVLVDNMANFNVADVDCGCLRNVTAKVSGNGEYSENDLSADLSNSLLVAQGGKDGNSANFDNKVDGKAKTGDNKAISNTGSGDPSDPVNITTGDAASDTTVKNSGNKNVYGSGLHVDLPEGLHLDFHFDLSDLMGLLHLS